MATKDLIKGHLRNAKTAINNTLIVSDSICNPYVTGSYANMTSKMISRFSTANTLFVGQVYGFVNAGVTTNGVYGGETQTGAAGITAGGIIRPGEAWPQTGETKINVRMTKSWYASGNVTAGQNYWQALDYPRGPANQDWPTSTTLSYTLSARSSPTAVGTWVAQCFSGSGGASGTSVSLAGLRAAAAYQRYQKTSFTTGTHTTSGLLCSIQPGLEAENGTTIRDVPLMCFGIRNTTRTTGTFWGQCGYGSWMPANHASEDGALITPDGVDYTGAYSDAALAHDYYCFQWNHVILWLSANPDNASDLLGSAQRFRTQVLNILARHRRAANSNGLTAPRFTLISQYFTSDAVITKKYFEMCRDILYDIALHDKNCELIDLFGHISDTFNESYEDWSLSGLADGVHPSTAGANTLSDRIETVGFGSNTTFTPPPNSAFAVPVPGPSFSMKLTAIGKGRVFRSPN